MISLLARLGQSATRTALALRIAPSLIAVVGGSLGVLTRPDAVTSHLLEAIVVVAIVAAVRPKGVVPTVLLALVIAESVVATSALHPGWRVLSALVTIVVVWSAHSVFSVAAGVSVRAVVDPSVVHTLFRRIALTCVVSLPIAGVVGLLADRAPSGEWLGAVGLVVGAALAATPLLVARRRSAS